MVQPLDIRNVEKAAWTLFLGVFAPEGWPLSVAPEYGRYQLWDTIQQVTFFVNTVISKQAVMKFHGVGDPEATAVFATALEVSRSLLAQTFSIVVATPGWLDLYRTHPRVFRMASEMLNSLGHFAEILAAIFTQFKVCLYLGPIICTLAGTMSGAVRSVILQHFARGGQLPPGREPDFGDISLKESNQDKGGKIFGLCAGVFLLLWTIGVGSGDGAEQASMYASTQWFVVLTLIHICGNVKTVQQLQIKPSDAVRKNSFELSHGQSAFKLRPLWQRMMLPKGYPHTVVESYAPFQLWGALRRFTDYPRQIVMSLLFWANVYGVGNRAMTPEKAVFINIFMAGVDCTAGLVTGLPGVSKKLDYTKQVWFLLAYLIGVVAQFLQILAACAPREFFLPVIVVSRFLAAFAVTSGSRVCGAIPNALMRKESIEAKEIELIHIIVANSNQGMCCSTLSGCVSIGLLYLMIFMGYQPNLVMMLVLFLLMYVLGFLTIVGQYRNLPPLPGDQLEELKQPLVIQHTTRTSKSITHCQDCDASCNSHNSYSAPESNESPPALV